MKTKENIMISDQMKETTILKLTSLLKRFLVSSFENIGYDPEETHINELRSKKAKMILETISRIRRDEEIEKEKLENLFDMYKTYHNGDLWKI